MTLPGLRVSITLVSFGYVVGRPRDTKKVAVCDEKKRGVVASETLCLSLDCRVIVLKQALAKVCIFYSACLTWVCKREKGAFEPSSALV